MVCLVYAIPHPAMSTKSQRATDPAAALVEHSEFSNNCHVGIAVHK